MLRRGMPTDMMEAAGSGPAAASSAPTLPLGDRPTLPSRLPDRPPPPGGPPAPPPPGALPPNRPIIPPRPPRAANPAVLWEQAARDGLTKHSALMVVGTIRKGSLGAVEALLAQMNAPTVAGNPVVPFAAIRGLHFARFLLHPAVPGRDMPDRLVFGTDVDGPLDEHIDDLARTAGPGLSQLFGHCQEWEEGHPDRLARFLRRTLRIQTQFVGARGVGSIRSGANMPCTNAFRGSSTAWPGRRRTGCFPGPGNSSRKR